MLKFFLCLMYWCLFLECDMDLVHSFVCLNISWFLSILNCRLLQLPKRMLPYNFTECSIYIDILEYIENTN